MRSFVIIGFLLALSVKGFAQVQIPVKQLSEFSRWLSFHGIKDSDFEKYANDMERDLKWYDYDLTDEYRELFRPFRLYSNDSIYFLDLDSYSLVLEKENGKLVSYGSEIDLKVQIIRIDNNQAATLLFCGTGCYPETAGWSSDKTLRVLGFSLDNNGYFVPTKWEIDLHLMLFSELRADKKFKEMPPSYMEQKRLELIEFKK